MSVISLPVDVLIKIAMVLPYSTLRHYCKTNKLFNSICHNQNFWRQKAQLDFPKPSAPFKLPETREEFHEVYLSQNCLPGANSYPNDCLEKAIEQENEAQIEYFIEHKPLNDSLFLNGLKEAAKVGNVDLAKRLFNLLEKREVPFFELVVAVSYGLGLGSQMHLVSRFERELLHGSIFPSQLARGIIQAGAHELIKPLLQKYPNLNVDILLNNAINHRKLSIINQLIKLKPRLTRLTLPTIGEVGDYSILQLLYSNGILTQDQLEELPFVSEIDSYSRLLTWLGSHPLIKLENILLGTGISGNLNLLQQILTHAPSSKTRLDSLLRVFVLAATFNRISILEYIREILPPSQHQLFANEALLEYTKVPVDMLPLTVETLLNMGATNFESVLEYIAQNAIYSGTGLIMNVQSDKISQTLTKLIRANLSGPKVNVRYISFLIGHVGDKYGPDFIDTETVRTIIIESNVLSEDEKEFVFNTLDLFEPISDLIIDDQSDDQSGDD